MAKFEISEAITGAAEGLYANDPADTGGETWAGISRNNWPKWLGWTIIDDIKKKYGKTAAIINKYGRANRDLNCLRLNFYKENFWDVNKLDQIKDQQLADSVYDFGVNSGTGRAAKFLQQAVSKFSRVTIDGQIGPQTLSAVNAVPADKLHAEYNRLRQEFYISIAKGSKVKFLKSWLSRLHPYKH